MTKLLGQKGSEIVGGYSFDKPIVKLYSKGVLLWDFSSGTPPNVSPAVVTHDGAVITMNNTIITIE